MRIQRISRLSPLAAVEGLPLSNPALNIYTYAIFIFQPRLDPYFSSQQLYNIVSGSLILFFFSSMSGALLLSFWLTDDA